jgi:LPXTG-site transpeptidase (sortase) family protein
VDTLDKGLAFMDPTDPANCTISSSGGTITFADAGMTFATICANTVLTPAAPPEEKSRIATFDFGGFSVSGGITTLTIEYRVVVLDIDGNQSGDDLGNGAVWTANSFELNASAERVTIVEPDLRINKDVDSNFVVVGGTVTYSLVISHTAKSTTDAFDVEVVDVVPDALAYVPGSLNCNLGPQDADLCTYDAASRTIRAVWNTFELGAGVGRINFKARVIALPPEGSITNIATVSWTSLPGDVSDPQTPTNDYSTERAYDPASTTDIYGDEDDAVFNVVQYLPQTGFAPNRVTDLSRFPFAQYSSSGGMTVEIPALGLNTGIVGVPFQRGDWNVAWLGNQLGWLAGTSFPTWSGNSVLTGHVYGADGLPGPFIDLNKLRYGDEIIIHAFGQEYIYEVRTNVLVKPDDLSAMKHETYSWLTLITCKEYDEKIDGYRYRVVVRAVLVKVIADPAE